MSQRLVRELLIELGGTATQQQIAALAKKKYPDLSLHTYVHRRLWQMKAWGEVEVTGGNSNKNIVWTLVATVDNNNNKNDNK